MRYKLFTIAVAALCIFMLGMKHGRKVEADYRAKIKKPMVTRSSSSIIDRAVDFGFQLVMKGVKDE